MTRINTDEIEGQGARDKKRHRLEADVPRWRGIKRVDVPFWRG
ncbi:MAG: hypothetical protein AB1414_01345 [bacterium]